MSLSETIYALATPSGGAIAIIRVSGDNAYMVSQNIVQGEIIPRYVHLKLLHDENNQPIDYALVIYFKGPLSFTGEDVIEFHLHGGIGVVEALSQRLLSLGIRQATPGEFTKRAFLNNKIDLTQAEAISAMVNAQSGRAAKLLARQLRGELGIYVESLRQELIEVLAFCEVSIDYADDDIPSDILKGIATRLSHVGESLSQTLYASKRRDGLFEGYRIAIVGKPNVGKSSLLNNLLSYERSIVSDIAGTTRDTVEETVRIGAHRIRFVDTAGIRQADEGIEKMGIARSKKAAMEANMIIAVFDGSREFDEEDTEVTQFLNELRRDKEILAIINKSDLPNFFDATKIDTYDPIYVSQNYSIEALVRAIEVYFEREEGNDESILVSQRQIMAVESALIEIEKSTQLLEEGVLELFSYHINEALALLGTLTRPVGHSEVLDAMFSNFCLGK